MKLSGSELELSTKDLEMYTFHNIYVAGFKMLYGQSSVALLFQPNIFCNFLLNWYFPLGPSCSSSYTSNKEKKKKLLSNLL